MGGSLGVTIRFENGSIEPMSRWTNSTPGFINSYSFAVKDEKHLNAYMQQWYDMKKDYDDNHNTGNYEFNMTPVYADHRLKSPDEYGMLVIDYMSNTILHCQGYTKYGTTAGSHYALMYQDRVNFSEEYLTETYSDLEELIKSDRLKIVETNYNKSDSYEVYLEKEKLAEANATIYKGDIGSFIKYCNDAYAKSYRSSEQTNINVIYDLSPWKIIRFPESKQGILDLKDKMYDLGFTFSAEEETAWSNYIENRYNNDENDNV